VTAEEFVQRIEEHFDAPWLGPAAAAVERRMDGDGGHDFGHLCRVFANAIHIAKHSEACDLEAIVAAVLFHDVVNLPKDHPERHLASTRSAEVAVEWFTEHGYEIDLDLVAEAIRCHSWSAGIPPESLEARIVCDADNLEAVGAFGIARTFYVSGRMGSAIIDMADPHAERRELDDTTFARDHFQTKLLQLREHMHTDAGRALADQRHRFMVGFLEQLDREIGEGAEGAEKAEG
jgi:uncharacterized protein